MLSSYVCLHTDELIVQSREMDFWCPAPLPNDVEPSFKLRSSEDYKAPPADLVEGYLSDSSIEADEDINPDATVASASNPKTST